MSNCALCNLPVQKSHAQTWKEVRGWVGGPRKDSMRLREDTGRFAHHECVQKLQAGQAIDQPSMFDPLPSDRNESTVDKVSLPEVLR